MFCDFESTNEGCKCKKCNFTVQCKDPTKVFRRCDEVPLVEKAVNFGKALIKHRQDDYANVDDAMFNNRMEICAGGKDKPKCENFDENKCRLCGCDLLTKLRWRSSQCPIGKW